MSLEARHLCRAISCDAIVRGALLMCKRHWTMVPPVLQTRIYEHYRPGQGRDFEPSPDWVIAARMATVHVARQEGRLADVLILLARLYDTEKERTQYLLSSQPLLGGKVPIELMRSTKGLRIVQEQLHQSATGAYL